eukprot:1036685-Prymnesium_polylepis.1
MVACTHRHFPLPCAAAGRRRRQPLRRRQRGRGLAAARRVDCTAQQPGPRGRRLLLARVADHEPR